jgi:two-component system OmpR family sensor kinase/two-component system sensor histidine kinase BaeS
MQQALWISALVAGGVALAAGSLLAASILRPLRRVEATVETIARGDLAARVTPVGRDEIGRLAEGVNLMAAGLQRQEELRQRMVSDIAHELRTPLSVIQGNLQAILDGVYPLEASEIRILFDESRLLSRLVEDLHELALAEAQRLPLQIETVPVSAALAQAADSFHALADGRGVRIVAGSAATLQVRADAGRLQQVLHNLIANALRHTPAGGEVRLDAATSAGMVRFTVTDSGAGIAAQDLPHIFDRFYRAEKDRARAEDGAAPASGSGLGLAIVKALVEAQGGSAGAESQAGRGTTVWFTLPAAGGGW